MIGLKVNRWYKKRIKIDEFLDQYRDTQKDQDKDLGWSIFAPMR